MTLLFLLFLTINTLFAQERISINPIKKTIRITNNDTYTAVNVDSSFSLFNHNLWGEEYKLDTFYYVKKTLIGEKNKIVVTPLFSSTTYKLNKALENKTLQQQDSIITVTIKDQQCARKSSKLYKQISCKCTPVQRYKQKYPYIDLYKTGFYDSKRRAEYTSRYTRIFVINDIFYLISVYTHSSNYMNSAHCSRKAVHRSFKHLIKTIQIIDPEDSPND